MGGKIWSFFCFFFCFFCQFDGPIKIFKIHELIVYEYVGLPTLDPAMAILFKETRVDVYRCQRAWGCA